MSNFRKVKKIKELRGDVLKYIAQAIQKIDAEIVKNDHLGMETNLGSTNIRHAVLDLLYCL